MTAKNYRHEAIWYPKRYDNHFNAKDFFLKSTYSLFEIIEKVEVSTMNLKKPKIILDVEDNLDKEYGKFITQFTDTYGRCYSMHVTEKLKSLGITKIKFVTKLSVYIFLDHPGQHLHANSRSKVIF